MAESPTTNYHNNNQSWSSNNIKKQRHGHRLKKLEPLADSQSSTKPNQMSKSKSIQHKKDLIDAVRKFTPAHTMSAPSLFQNVSSNLKTGNIDESDVRQQLNIVENGVNEAARRYNDLHILCDRRTQELKLKLDDLETLKTEFEVLHKMKRKETVEADRITKLNEETAKVSLEIAQKTHYQRQLEHMLQRLHRNQLKFDAHLNGMEEARRAVEKECEDVRLLRRTMDAGLVRAHYVAQETQDMLEIRQKEREVLLARRKNETRNALQLQEWMRNRAIVKAELATELRGDLTKEEEMLLRTQLREKEENTKKLQRANEDSQKRMTSMEEAFMLIKQVTGVSSLEEMVEKFSNQRINKKNLEKDVRESEQKLSEVKRYNIEAEEAFQDIKASGSGSAELNRELTENIENQILTARNEFKITKAATERLGTVLISLRQGAHGLMQRVQPYLELVDSTVFELTATRGSGGGGGAGGEEEDIWAETMDALSTSEQVLSKLLELGGGGGGGEVSPSKLGSNYSEDNNNMDMLEYGFDEAFNHSLGGSIGTRSVGSRSMAVDSPPQKNNVRVKSRRYWRSVDISEDVRDNYEMVPGGGAGGGGGGVGGNAADHGLLNADIFAGNDEEGLITGGAGGGRDGGGGLASSSSMSALSNNMKDTTDVVMSRAMLKKGSLRTSQDAVKKVEMATRRRRIAERMVTGELEEKDIGYTARIKAQQAMANRLSATHHPVTLPEGVTLRDGPMEKTEAFLKTMPKLN